VTRRRRLIIAAGVLVALQLAAVLLYRAVERARDPDRAAPFRAERFAVVEPAPAFAARRLDGSEVAITWPSPRVRIIHFWATWCEPCRDELPGLLAFARAAHDHGLEVVAVAVDDDWREIQAFFAGAVPSNVVIAREASLHKRFGVSTLPDSYLVDRTGTLVERYHGARDWGAAAARAHVLALAK
jgi:thiol-disulfide isomerase/thioredoxin